MPNVALQNAMVCRVYRLLKMGLLEEDISIFRTSMFRTYGDKESGPDVRFASIRTASLDRAVTYVESFGMTEMSREDTCVEEIPSPVKMSRYDSRLGSDDTAMCM